ncbi:hypothetical protein GQ43DRAFT_184175 [Delitschia confertaspora ATCC 74209]|uniref:2EXR domain-containing protein n=1 Tax=Delitschia confertaspora ATCC 74209 TaxID=1513339 RepID=A0A9P4MPG8_9PLEO|nr:hypothetical protein GQ43DRAFT_184175 [Delitschia confertaspora ATCC 74209]
MLHQEGYQRMNSRTNPKRPSKELSRPQKEQKHPSPEESIAMRGAIFRTSLPDSERIPGTVSTGGEKSEFLQLGEKIESAKQSTPKIGLDVSESFPFMELPLEIRDMIFPYVFNWPVYTKIQHGASCPVKKKRIIIKRRIPKCHKTPMWPPTKNTPAILLVNREIKEEALSALLRIPLIFDEAPPYVIQHNPEDEKQYLTTYLRPALLCEVHKMTLFINHSLSDEDDNRNIDQFQVWDPWNIFMEYLWVIWYRKLPQLHLLTVHIGGQPAAGAHGIDYKGDGSEYGSRDCEPREWILFMLAGIIRMVDKKCEVKVEGATKEVVEFLEKQRFSKPRNLVRIRYCYEQLQSEAKATEEQATITKPKAEKLEITAKSSHEAASALM